MDKYEKLEKIQKLKDNGIITEEEFVREKTKILNEDTKSIKNNNTKEKKGISTGLLLVIVLVIIGVMVFIGEKINESNIQETNKVTQQTKLVTHEQYEKIQRGMSYEQVCNIFGISGIYYAEDNLNGRNVVYKWKMINGKTIILNFNNNKLAESYIL